MERIEKDILKRVLFVIFGLFIVGTGAALFLHSRLGADPNGVFMEGFSIRMNISYGTSALICNGVLAILVYGIDKNYINIATIIASIVPGYTVDLMLHVLENILNIDNTIFLNQAFLSLVSGIFISFGIVIYIKQNLGMGSFDAISELISDRKSIKFSTVRRSIDLLMLTLGYLLGGVVGIGTIYLGLATGSLISIFRKALDNITNKKEYKYI